jgi:integrase
MTDQTIRHARRQRRRLLTDKMVAALPRQAQPYFHPDPELPKHGIRVRPQGPGAYTVITRDPLKKQRWVKIGSVAELTIAEARDQARTVIRRVEAGLEPFPAPKPKPETVAAVAANWLHRHVEKKKLRTAAERRRLIEKYVLPHWGDRSFVEIKRRDIAGLLDHIEDKHGAAMADQVLSVLRAVASWVQSRDETYTPPFTRNMRRVPAHDRKRSRILSDDELRRVWHTATDAGVYGAVIKLLLLTAQRCEKIASACWSDIKDGTWTIRTAPREKGNPGRLQLPKQALAVLRDIPRFVGNDFIFAGHGNRQHVFSWVRQKAALDRASGVRDWRVHDLRRSARSLMSRAGVATEIAERVLGHARPAMESTYDVHSYDSEKASALAKLANLIERIVSPPANNAVTLQETAGVS